MVVRKNMRNFVVGTETTSFRLNVTDMDKNWKPLKDFEGIYEISSDGDIKRLERVTVDVNGRHLHYDEKIIKTCVDKDGYLTVRLVQENGFVITRHVHVLVARTFIPNTNNLPCVNHKDENKLNPKVSNLEWCSYSYNNTYGTVLERRKTLTTTTPPENSLKIATDYQTNGVVLEDLSEPKKKHQKFVVLIDKNGEEIHRYKSVSEAGRENGFDRHLFSRTETKDGVKIIKNKIFIVEEKKNEYIPKGKNCKRPDISAKLAKKVCQYDKDGTYIQTFDSVKLAAEYLGKSNKSSDIVNCCNGKLKSAHGFLWRYDGCEPPQPFEHKTKKKIEQFSFNGELIATHESIADAIKYLGKGTPTCIGNNLAGRSNSAYGYIWKYAE